MLQFHQNTREIMDMIKMDKKENLLLHLNKDFLDDIAQTKEPGSISSHFTLEQILSNGIIKSLVEQEIRLKKILNMTLENAIEKYERKIEYLKKRIDVEPEPSKYQKDWVASVKEIPYLREMWKQHLGDHNKHQKEVELPKVINEINETEQKIPEIDNEIKKLNRKLRRGSLGRKKVDHPKVKSAIKRVVSLDCYKDKLKRRIRRLKEKELMIRTYDPNKVISNYMDLSPKVKHESQIKFFKQFSALEEHVKKLKEDSSRFDIFKSDCREELEILRHRVIDGNLVEKLEKHYEPAIEYRKKINELNNYFL